MNNQYIGGEWPMKGGLGQFADLRGDVAKKRGVVFMSVMELIPQYTV